MRIPRRAAPALIVAALVAGACGGDPQGTIPASVDPSPTTPPAPSITPVPFAPAAFPVAGSACGTEGYAGRLGRIEAVDARTVRFTLCAPDGAFPATLAHPSLGIWDATTIALLAEDRTAGRAVSGTGAYVIDRWIPGDNVQLRRVAAEPGAAAVSPLIILRFEPDPAARLDALSDAVVDGIDAPGPTELDTISTLPELVTTPRDGLSTAFLAFGSGPAFAGARVRRAIAGALDRPALVRDAFPQGSSVATHVAPCGLPGACGGRAWYDFNAPSAATVLADAGFDLERSYPLHVPDAALPGLSDPARVAEAIAAQLAANIGLSVTVDVMPAPEFRERVGRGTLDGLYLDGTASAIPEAAGFLAPVFGDGVRTTPARRASGVSTALAEAAATADPEARAAALIAANTSIRGSAVIVPLAHEGSVVTFRADVTPVATSPLGLDPLGAATPGDRPQLVFLQASEPEGAWCGDQPSLDAYRLCGLLTDGLYGFATGDLDPQPRLAQACEPDETATVWTCRLRAGRTFADGLAVDAGDVLASFTAQWDASGQLRSGAPEGAFGAWDELFGGPLDLGG